MDAKNVLKKLSRDKQGSLKSYKQCLSEMTSYFIQEEKMEAWFAEDLAKKVMRESGLWNLESAAEILGVFGLALVLFSVFLLTPGRAGHSTPGSMFHIYPVVFFFILGVLLSVASRVVRWWWKKNG